MHASPAAPGRHRHKGARGVGDAGQAPLTTAGDQQRGGTQQGDGKAGQGGARPTAHQNPPGATIGAGRSGDDAPLGGGAEAAPVEPAPGAKAPGPGRGKASMQALTRTRLEVNGSEREITAEPGRTLLEALRGDLGLTGAKPGCGEGACGACTVLLDGAPVRSCLLALEEAAGRRVTTAEGLAAGGRLHPVQQAFVEAGAMQCGYCTPGLVVAAAALLQTNPNPGEAELRSALDGHICRCGGYPRIVAAVRRAAQAPSAGAAAPQADPAGAAASAPRGEGRPWDLLAPEERGYFDILGDGLVAVLAPNQPRAAGGTVTGGAWLHVGAGGVTAFTGKVDFGQGTDAALRLLVAEELRVPVAAVRLRMGDTDLCPFDPGTFGSRSMVDAGEYLRAAAAAAREHLRGLAAERWQIPPAGLRAAGGAVHEPGGRALPYAELVRGVRQVVAAVAAGAPTTPGTEWETAGRVDAAVSAEAALQVVTGARRFPGDLTRPGLLHGRVLRAPAYGARLRHAELAAARALPGVTVLQEGDFVGVAAPDPGMAERALQAIAAEWERQPQVGEDELAAHLRAHPVTVQSWAGGFHHETGDVEASLAAAEVRLAETYTTAYIAHVPLETRAALAEWRDGRVTVWTATQRPFGVRAELAQALGVAEQAVRVIVPPTGAGFGGKHQGTVAVEAARLARAAGAPVRVAWSRREEFTWGYLRPAAVIDVRSGAAADGRLLAWDFRNLNSGSAGIGCPYTVDSQRLDYQPAASPLPQGAYRALAATANHFARESHLDELAHRLGLDALEFRLRHLRDPRLAAVLRTAAATAGWDGPRPAGRALGIAAGLEKGGRVATCAEVAVDARGRLQVLRLVTACECGAIVHPEGLRRQVEGATLMGLGGALFEAIRFGDGEIHNASLLRYRVPRLSDVPPLEVVLLDRPDLPSAGAGEFPIVAVAPALANAIFAATGRRLRGLPLAPDGLVV